MKSYLKKENKVVLRELNQKKSWMILMIEKEVKKDQRIHKRLMKMKEMQMNVIYPESLNFSNYRITLVRR